MTAGAAGGRISTPEGGLPAPPATFGCYPGCVWWGLEERAVVVTIQQDDLVQMRPLERIHPRALDPRAADDHGAAVRDRDDRGVLVDPDPVELVVEP